MKKISSLQLLFTEKIFLFLLLISASVGCQNRTSEIDINELPERPLREKVLSREEQMALTPDSVILALKAGNARFVANDLTLRNHSAMVRDAAAGQYPKAVVLSCLDARIPVEDVFDRGIGDLFVARVAGNFANTDILGSMEFGCKVSGAKVILVLGHESCGAVKGAIDDVKLGNITSMLSNLKPAVAKAAGFSGAKTSSNADFVEQVALANVQETIAFIKANSSILNEMEASGQIKIIGAYYDLHTGVVKFL